MVPRTILQSLWRPSWRVFAVTGWLLLHAGPAVAQDAFADAVHELSLGRNGGFGTELLPGIVLGPPRGGGLLQGAVDVAAIGIGGSIVLRFDLPLICDGPGADFTIFENAFHSGSPDGPLFAEYAFVSVSQDGTHYVDVPHDAVSHVGLAGQQPVLSTPDNGLDPLDPAVSGGDAFDLAPLGLAWVKYVRITDVGGVIADLGDLPQLSVAPNAGFDLDAVAALHACDPTVATPTPTPSAALPTATASASPTPTLEGGRLGDFNDDGVIDDADMRWLVNELFDGDGSAAIDAAGGSVASGANADTNQDQVLTAADLVGLVTRRTE